jgi:hypothetical protein
VNDRSRGELVDRGLRIYRAAVPGLEAVISLVLVVACVAYTARFLGQVRHNSLWTDELFETINFGDRGPWHAATDYHTANNHVLQTVLSAATPGGLFNPFRPRLVSFVAIIAADVIVVVEFARRRWFLIGALMLYLMSVNFEWLNLNSQARGYGLMALCAVAGSLAAWRILEEDRWWSLIVLAVASAAGIYAVPSFAFFAAPLWLFLGIVVRRRRLWLVGGAAAAVTLLLYAPILGPLITAFRGYADEFGRQFTSLNSVAETLHDFLLSPSVTRADLRPWAVFTVFGLVLIVPQLVPVPRPVRNVSRVLLGSVVVLFAIALYLQTPIPRTLAFVVVPFALAGLVVLGALYARPSVRLFRPVVALVVVIPLTISAWQQTASLKVLPVEDWLGVGRVIDQTFPDNMPVGIRRNPEYLDVYLHDSHRVNLDVDPPAFYAGRQVFVDVFFKTLTPDTDMSGFAPLVADFRVPQQYGLYTRVLAAPPLDPHVASVDINGQTEATARLYDRSPAGYTSPPLNTLTAPLTITVHPTGGPSRSMLIVTDNGSFAPIMATARQRDGQPLPIAVDQQAGVTRLLLGDRDLDQIELTIAPFPDPRPITIEDLWIYPPT